MVVIDQVDFQFVERIAGLVDVIEGSENPFGIRVRHPSVEQHGIHMSVIDATHLSQVTDVAASMLDA
ncbi:MAG: hypothetical protein JO183_03900 [Ktedonobacteraceae bacterium]|nr:hypothetical protein [Ktedonobacteraceae bacterium]